MKNSFAQKRPLALACFSLAIASTASANEIEGAWSELTDFSIIPMHVVTMPDGRILSYGRIGDNERGGAHVNYDIWDPSLGTGPDAHIELPNTTEVDSFCSAMLLMPQTGRVLSISGGPLGRNETVRNADVIAYDWRDNSVTRLDRGINRQRWYASPVMNAKGEIALFAGKCAGQSAGPCSNENSHIPEIYRPGKGWEFLSNIDNQESRAAFRDDNTWWYPRAFLMGTGDVYTLSMGHEQRVISLEGNGAMTVYPDRGTKISNSDHFGPSNSAVMYRPDQVLITGGGGYSANGGERTGRNNASIIDLRSGAPEWQTVQPMNRPRQWHNTTVLPDGTVIVTGGSRRNNMLEGIAYEPEIWDPITNTWSLMAPEPKPRLYHSSAVLLPDGRVMSGGGGAPGPVIEMNAALFSPPYLFKPGMADRLKITGGPNIVSWAEDASFVVNDASRVDRMTMVGYSATTHSANFGQRFNELSFTRDGDTIRATMPSNPNHAPPGYYMVFALDRDGVPSLAFTVRVLAPDTSESPDQKDLPQPTVFGTGAYASSSSNSLPNPPAPEADDLLNVNGSFEDNTVRSGRWAVTELEGWIGRTEVWKNLGKYRGDDGDSWIELDTYGNVKDTLTKVLQTKAGEPYTISFAHAPRPGVRADSNRFDVLWNGEVIDTIERSGVGLNSLNWETATYEVLGTEGEDQLSFVEYKSDGLGTMIDDFQIERGTVNLNGSFEYHGVLEGGRKVTSIAGWTGRTEIWRNYNGYQADDGHSWIELDTHINTKDVLEKTFDLQPGSIYTLSFANAPRPGRPAPFNAFEVLWNGTLLDTIARSGAGHDALQWETNTYDVTAAAGQNTLTFREITSTGTGTMIDHVELLTAREKPSLNVNFSFEENDVKDGKWKATKLRGWDGIMEVWRKNHNGIQSYDGDSHVEIDYFQDGNEVSKSYATTAGQSYKLSFAHSPRPKISAASNQFEVYWNDQLLDTIAEAGSWRGPTWRIYEYNVIGTGDDKLRFVENDADSSGALLDAVWLEEN